MGWNYRKWLLASPAMLVALLLLFVAADGMRGQWKIVAPNAVISHDPRTGHGAVGALSFSDGVLWAGYTNLSVSTDSGRTWNQTNFSKMGISSISFLNRDTGIALGSLGAYATTNRGVSWERLPSLGFSQVSYYSSVIIYGISANGFWESSDGGQSWNGLRNPGGDDFAVGHSGDLFLQSFGNIAFSDDSGRSWIAEPGMVDRDAYSVDIDSCDASIFYVVAENYYIPPQDSISRIFVSRNQGVTWQTTFASPLPYLSGSFSSSVHAQYVATISDGILRSTDQGQTWNNIGGPGNVVDSRCICAISDNIVFALDSAGNIWATFNSGGDSVRSSAFPYTFSTFPHTLFISDTVQCDSLNHSLYFSIGGCPPPSVSSWSIVGSNAANFAASNLSNDSILVTLYGNGAKEGNQNAMLVLFLDNGSRDTVPLAGFVNNGANALTLSTADVKTDTLGATVAVPITINGLEHAEDVDLVLHYDGSVDYLGSFSPSGAKLDVAGEARPGRSELHIPGAAPGAIAGYAKFVAWNDSNSDAHATFDSLNILTAISPCEYSLPELVTSTISAPSGCAIPILSQLIHLGKEPLFRVVPNPSNGNVSISSSLDLGEVTIAIYDLLGTERSRFEELMAGNIPITLPLPEADGIYTIVLHSASGMYNLRVVRHR